MKLVTSNRPAICGGRPVRSQLLALGAPFLGKEEIDEVIDTLRSGWIGFGPKCLRLEADFAKYVHAPHALSLSSCTAGLHLALIVAGVGPGDDVITTPLTFPATANAIELVKGRPVFVDVDQKTQNIDADAIAAAVTSRTKVLMPVHMAGRPCDMDFIGSVARRHGLTVIEDAAHAIEAAWDGQKVGSLSRFTAFSFYATKNLTTAEGGMLTTEDGEAAEQIRSLRLHGLNVDAWERYSATDKSSYDTLLPGYKYNLTDLQASLGLHQLTCLEARLAIRERHWRTYDSAFADLAPYLETPMPPRPKERHARHLYTIGLGLDRLSIGRDQFLRALRAENIGAGIHFRPVHLHSYYREKYGFRPGEFPNAEDIGARTVSLPLSAKLSDTDVDDVITAVRRVIDFYAR